MSEEELVAFNPILANAFAQFAAKSDPEVSDYMRSIVAICVKTGADPEKIYATIKTGVMLTHENMPLLSEADIDEWREATEEYRRLANRGHRTRRMSARSK
jgi:hypothetical protein